MSKERNESSNKKIEILFLSISKSITNPIIKLSKYSQTQSISKMSRQSISKMSRQSNKGAKVAPAPQPYCAHCFNLKKPESEYRSHFLRASPDPKSAVVCPELLATNCRYCLKNGHTVGACPVLAAKKRDEEREAKQIESEARLKQQSIEQKKQTDMKKQQSKGSFAALFDSSDDEAEMTLKVSSKVSKKPISLPSKIETFEEKFPALPTKTATVVAAPKLMNYAGMAAKSKSEYEDEQFNKAEDLIKFWEEKLGIDLEVLMGKNFELWDGWDEEQDEMEYAINQIKAQEQPKKVLKASELDWTATYDSDDEDW